MMKIIKITISSLLFLFLAGCGGDKVTDAPIADPCSEVIAKDPDGAVCAIKAEAIYKTYSSACDAKKAGATVRFNADCGRLEEKEYHKLNIADGNRIPIEYLEIPDYTFWNCIQKTGAKYVDEVKELACAGEDFTGLEYLTFLEELSIETGYFTADLKNLTNLKRLNLKIDKPLRIADKLDLSMLKQLRSLSLQAIYTFSLDLSQLTELSSVNIISPMHELDLTDNVSLSSLSFKGEYIKQLDLSHNKNIKSVDINVDELTEVIFPSGGQIKDIKIIGPSLSELSVAELPNLESLSVKAPLDALDVTQNSKLKTLLLKGDFYASLDLKPLTKLEHLALASIDQANPLPDISGLSALTTLDLSGSEVTMLDLSAFKALSFVVLPSGLERLNVSNTQIKAIGYNEIALVEFVAENTPIKGLSLIASNLEVVRLENSNLLEDVSIFSDELSTLDLSGATSLVKLALESTSLESLDLSDNVALKELILKLPRLDELSLSENKALQKVEISAGNMKNIDFSPLNSLAYLNLNVKTFNSLDLSSNTSLVDTFLVGLSPRTVFVPSKVLSALTLYNCESKIDLTNVFFTQIYRLEVANCDIQEVDLDSFSGIELLEFNQSSVAVLKLGETASEVTAYIIDSEVGSVQASTNQLTFAEVNLLFANLSCNDFAGIAAACSELQ